VAGTNPIETLNRVIASLQVVRDVLADHPSVTPPGDRQGRYINAPVWPWFAAGWLIGALFVLLFLLAWTSGRT
jgi:hypothetical protein